MLRLDQNLSLEDNNFIKINSNIYQIPATYTSIEGKYDLYMYDSLTIIIPETIHFFDSLCLTCSSASPTNTLGKQPNHKIIFNHNTFKNVVFSSLCFDGIAAFEFKSDEIAQSIPYYISSYPRMLIVSDFNKYLTTKLYEESKNKIDDLIIQLDNIKILLKNMNNDKSTIKELKSKLIKYDKVKNKLIDINKILI